MSVLYAWLGLTWDRAVTTLSEDLELNIEVALLCDCWQSEGLTKDVLHTASLVDKHGHAVLAVLGFDPLTEVVSSLLLVCRIVRTTLPPVSSSVPKAMMTVRSGLNLPLSIRSSTADLDGSEEQSTEPTSCR